MTTVDPGANNPAAYKAQNAAMQDATKQKDQFLRILLTQLQHQNPLDPQKPEDFASQLAQYSALEQQINTNTKLDSLLSALNSNAVSPVSYLGTTIDYDSATSPVQDGYANWSYSVAGAVEVTLEVKDADGNVIYTGPGDTTSAMQSLSLEATGAPDGVPLTLSILAKDADGKVIEPIITSRAKVTAVTSANGVTILEADGHEIASSLVHRIATTKQAQTPAPESTNS